MNPCFDLFRVYIPVCQLFVIFSYHMNGFFATSWCFILKWTRYNYVYFSYVTAYLIPLSMVLEVVVVK
jgi:hypothetical protein